MKFISSIKHAGQQFIRNKSRGVILMFGIVISITLISGILYAADGLTTYSVETSLSTTPFDIAVNSNTSLVTVTSGWNSLESGSTDFDAYYLDKMYVTDSALFVSNPDGIGGGGMPPGGGGASLLQTQRGAVLELNETTPPNASAAFYYTSILAADISLLTFLNESGIVNLLELAQASFDDNEVIVDSNTAALKGLSVGSNVTLYTFWSDNTSFQVTNLTVVGIFRVLDTTKLFNGFYPANLVNESESQMEPDGGIFGSFNTFAESFISRILEMVTSDSCFLFTNLVYGRQIIANASSSTPATFLSTLKYRYLFKLNHATLPINNIDDLSTTMAYIETHLQQATGITETFTDYITDSITAIQSDLTFFELISLMICVPAIVLGVYLTMILYNLALEQRRREFGILKTRGASTKDVIKIAILEASFIAVVGGLVGSLLGMGISYGIISQILGSSFESFLAITPFSINWMYVLASIAFAVALTLLASLKPIKTYSQLSVIENITYYNEGLAMKRKKGRIQWIALVVGLIPVILLLITNLQSTTSSPTMGGPGVGMGMAGLGSVLYNILDQIGSALTWFSPVLLAYALIKIIIGNSPQRFSQISRKIASIFSKKTSYLVATNITRNPKRSSQVVTIIAITVCFGLIAQVVQASQNQYTTDQVYLTVGADIRVTSTNTGYALQSQIEAVSTNISRVTTVAIATGTVSSTTTAPMRVIGLNKTSLLQTVDLDSVYFYGEDPETIVTTLDANQNGALLSETLATPLGLETRDNLTLVFTNSTATMTLTIMMVGYMQLLPGVSSSSATTIQGEIFVNYRFLNDTVVPYLSSVNYIYLVDLVNNPTESPAEIKEAIKTTLGSQVTSIITLDEELQALASSTGLYQNVITLMSFQFPFLLVIATFGIMMVTILSLVEKKREQALVRVKGVTEGQQVRMQLAEGLVLIIIGMIAGAALGFPLAYLSNVQLDSLSTYASTLNLSRPYVVPFSEVALILILIPALFFAIILLTNYIQSKKSRIGPITEILRNY